MKPREEVVVSMEEGSQGQLLLLRSLLATPSNSSTDAHPTLRTPGLFAMALPGFTLREIDSAIKPYEILSISSPGSEAALTSVFAIPSSFWLFCAGAT